MSSEKIKRIITVSFDIEQTLVMKKTNPTWVPTDRFIEGCLKDLSYTHGLKCDNVRIDYGEP